MGGWPCLKKQTESESTLMQGITTRKLLLRKCFIVCLTMQVVTWNVDPNVSIAYLHIY